MWIKRANLLCYYTKVKKDILRKEDKAKKEVNKDGKGSAIKTKDDKEVDHTFLFKDYMDKPWKQVVKQNIASSESSWNWWGFDRSLSIGG